MKTKWHIKPNGTPGVCKAKEGNCPYGQAKHFQAKENAQEFMDKLHQKYEDPNFVPDIKEFSFKQKDGSYAYLGKFASEHKDTKDDLVTYTQVEINGEKLYIEIIRDDINKKFPKIRLEEPVWDFIPKENVEKLKKYLNDSK